MKETLCSNKATRSVRGASRLSASLLAVVVIGCSGSNETGTTPAGDGGLGGTDSGAQVPGTYDEYQRAYAHALCQALFECDPHDDWTTPAFFGTVPRCEATYQEVFGTEARDFAPSVFARWNWCASVRFPMLGSFMIRPTTEPGSRPRRTRQPPPSREWGRR